MRRELPLPGAAFGAALLVLAAPAESRDGFYLGAELGLADAATLESNVSGVNHPTRCDRLLYGGNPPAFTATDPVCTDNTSRALTNNAFDLDMGFAGGLAAGYRRGAWRFELEYLHRQHGGETRPLRTPAANTALAGKSAGSRRNRRICSHGERGEADHAAGGSPRQKPVGLHAQGFPGLR